MCVQCLLVLYASVHEVCANTHIYIYNANTSKFKYIFILEFLVAVRLVTCLEMYPRPNLGLLLDPRGDEEAAHFSLPGRGAAIYINITTDPCKKSSTVVIPIPQRYSDIECHRLYTNSTTIQNTTTITITTLSLLTPPNQLAVARVPAF